MDERCTWGFPVYYIFNHYNDTGFISSYDMNILLVKHPRKQFSYVLLTQNMAKLRCPLARSLGNGIFSIEAIYCFPCFRANDSNI